VKVHFTKTKGKDNYKVMMMTIYGAELSKESNNKRKLPNRNKEAKQEHIYELKWNDNGMEKMKENEAYEKWSLRR